MNPEYDSEPDTREHIQRVRTLLGESVENLKLRSYYHDASKLKEPEKSAFDYATPRLKGSTYGSDEYNGFLAELKTALDHHYAENSHHPEHFPWRCSVCESQYAKSDWESAPQGPNDSGDRFCPKCCKHGIIYECGLYLVPENGVNGMSLLDVLEMLCDWKAAGERHADGSIERSLRINRDRFKIGYQLQSILENTARELGWIPANLNSSGRAGDGHMSAA